MQTFVFKSVTDFLEVAAQVSPLVFGDIKIREKATLTYRFRETPTVVEISNEGVFVQANAFDEVTFAAFDLMDIIEGEPYYNDYMKDALQNELDRALYLTFKKYKELCSFINKLN